MFSFPEMWLARVIVLVTSLAQASWLDGIPELDTEVLEIGTGSASEQNLIHIPLDIFEVDVLINNSTYPIPKQDFVDGEAVVKLDKFQTKVTTLSDDKAEGASYSKIDSATRAHTTAIKSNKFKKAIHALAPAKHTFHTPVVETTGATDGARKKLIYQDLVRLKRKLDKAGAPVEGRRLVLTDEHINDLLEDRDRFANLLSDMNSGKVAPLIAGFKIYQYAANPYFYKNNDEWTKRPYGTVPTNSDHQASVCFVESNVAKKTGKTKQYFTPASANPSTQANELNYRHYFMALPMRQRYMGAIVSGGSITDNVPQISSITPTTAESADTITINGVNFTGATAVKFDSTNATSYVIVSDTVITAVVPALADGTYDVTVVGPAGTSNEEEITIESGS